MTKKNGDYIMMDPTKSEEFKQMILERRTLVRLRMIVTLITMTIMLMLLHP